MNSNWSYSLEMPNLGQNHQFRVQCDLKIWRMTLKNKRTSWLCYFKLSVSFHSHWSIQAGVTVWLHPILGQNRQVFVPCDLEIWQMTLKNNRAPLLCHFKLSASLHSHWPIRDGVTVWKRPIWIKFDDFFASCDLEILQMTLNNDRAPLLYPFKLYASFHSHWWVTFEFLSGNAQIGSNLKIFAFCILEILRMTLKNNRAPLLSNIKLCASFHHHIWIQTGVTVRKWLSWVLTSVTLTFDLWPWPFAWTSLLSLVITPKNFMMIRSWEHSQKGVTGGQTDGRTDRLNHS